MRILYNCFGRKVPLTHGRLAHILEHTEMRGMEGGLEQALLQPQLVRRPRSDPPE